MTQDAVVKLSDSELVQVVAWAQAEQKARTEKHKQDTIAKIRELARSIEVGVAIEGIRGRPPKKRTTRRGMAERLQYSPADIKHMSATPSS